MNHFAFILMTLIPLTFAQAQDIGIINASPNKRAVEASLDPIDFIVKGAPPEEKVQGRELIPIVDGTHMSPLEVDCLPQKMEDEILAKRAQGPGWGAEFRKYFERCGKRLTDNRLQGLLALGLFALNKYDFANNSSLHPVFAETSDGVQTFGYLGIKKGSTPRPLLIVKCGLYCSAVPSTSTRNYMMNLFDESPFHILLLANYSAPEHVSHNRELVFGGYAEAQGLIELADWAKKLAPFKSKVSDVHLLGISLGGHASLFASYYNDRVREMSGAAPFASIMAICPAVQLETTIKGLFTKGDIIGKITSFETWLTMKKVYPYIPEAHDLYDPLNNPNYPIIPDVMATVAYRYLSRKQFPAYVPSEIHSAQEFWKFNTFSGYLAKIKTPTLVFTSEDDMLVKTEINTRVLQQELASSKNPNVQIHTVPKGNHCGYASNYGHDFMTRLVRSYVIAHSPNFGKNQSPTQTEFYFPKVKLGHRETHVMQKWSVKPKSDLAELTFVIHGPYDASCSKTPFSGSHFCQRQEKFVFPLKNLPKAFTPPKNEPEAHALTRLLNSSFEITGANGRITGTVEQPKKIKWYKTWF
ncbi:MAG: alpha/beta hydrolase family protein [Pseudobdellovibrionaceae bacterium]